MIIGSFPTTRLRRLRQTPWIRRLVAETSFSVSDLILPIFVRDPRLPEEIPSLPGVFRYRIDQLAPLVQKIIALKIPAIALFPCLIDKTDDGREALNPDSLLCRAIQEIKCYAPNLGVIADVALDPYTSHGHDGILCGDTVDNDKTLAFLCEQACVQAAAGADILAPSDMMDGRVRSLRDVLEREGYGHKSILSYSAKYASSFYTPFRAAVNAPSLGGPSDKKTYQMSFLNTKEALREVALDIEEGTDIVMVKPGLPYLDILQRITSSFSIPAFVYQVSGEYAMIKSLPHEAFLFYETFIAFKRAGASAILSYAALDMAQWLQEGIFEE